MRARRGADIIDSAFGHAVSIVEEFTARRDDNDVGGLLGQADVREDEERDQEKLKNKNPALPGPLARKGGPHRRRTAQGPRNARMVMRRCSDGRCPMIETLQGSFPSGRDAWRSEPAPAPPRVRATTRWTDRRRAVAVSIPCCAMFLMVPPTVAAASHGVTNAVAMSKRAVTTDAKAVPAPSRAMPLEATESAMVRMRPEKMGQLRTVTNIRNQRPAMSDARGMENTRASGPKT